VHTNAKDIRRHGKGISLIQIGPKLLGNLVPRTQVKSS
jgi:hypothetical protein